MAKGRPRPEAIDGYLNTEQAAEFLGVKPRTLYNWHQKGKGPRRFVQGRVVRYRRADLDAWITGKSGALVGVLVALLGLS